MLIKKMNKNIKDTKPQDLKKETLLKFLSVEKENDDNYQQLKKFAISDGGNYNKKEIQERIDDILTTIAIELERREGFIEIKEKEYDWFSEYSIDIKIIKCPYCNTCFEVSKYLSKCPICDLNLRRYFIYLLK